MTDSDKFYIIALMKFTSKQRAYLRSQAQTIDPVVYVGKDGYSDGVRDALDQALGCHELVKVRFQNSKDQIKEISSRLASGTASDIVATTGFTTVFFRQNENPEDRIYDLRF